MKKHQRKPSIKSITITVERLSDTSRITFTISSDKTIKQLRSLLNHHLPPHTSNKFLLYSYQRGALIHFHPPTFKLDYFPVIFDQSVLLLKMDDRINETQSLSSSSLSSSSPSKTNTTKKHSFSEPITCLSVLKQFFRKSTGTQSTVNTDNQANVLIY